MNKADKIIYNIADYNSREELIDAVLKQARIFIENKKVFSFHETTNKKGTYVLQFGSSDMQETNVWPVWLDSEEILYISTYASQNEYVNAKKLVDNYEEDDDIVIVDGDKKTDA